MSPTQTAKSMSRPLQRVAYAIALGGLNIALVLASILMMLLLLAGFWQIGKGVYSLRHQEIGKVEDIANISHLKTPHLSMATNAVHMAIEGIELLFLAPLGYLIVWGLIKYVHAATPQQEGTSVCSDLLSQSISEGASCSKHVAMEVKARSDLTVLKAFTVSLFIAVIAATLLAAALSGSMNYEFTICGSIIIGILILYFWVLEKLASELANDYHSKLKEVDAGPRLRDSRVDLTSGSEAKP